MRARNLVLALCMLAALAGCSGGQPTVSPKAAEGVRSLPQRGAAPKAREVTIPVPTDSERESGDLGEACRLISGPHLDRLAAAVPARSAANNDERWKLFYYALVDGNDDILDWFDAGGAERAINFTCDPSLEGRQDNIVTIYCDLTDPCRPPR